MDRDAPGPSRERRLWTAPANQFVISAILLFVATSLAMLTKPWLGEGYASLIFVVGIMLIGALSGLVRAVVTAIIGAAAFNFYVAEPAFAFRFSTSADFAPPAVFVVCAVISGILSGRLRDLSRVAIQANARLESLLRTSLELQTVRSDRDLRAVVQEHLAGQGGLAARLYWRIDGVVRAVGPVDRDTVWDSHARAAIDSAQTTRATALRDEPIGDGRTVCGALVFAPAIIAAEDLAFVTALARVSSLALTRLRLDTEVADSRVIARSEELKSALLSSVSHDLRTPLTTIGTAASSILTFGDDIDATTRSELLTSIVDECDRLNRLTENLLQMSRLQAGSAHLSGNVLAVQDMIRRCVAQLRAQVPDHVFTLDLPHDDILVVADTALFELALINVLQNAAKYSPPGSRVSTTCTADADACVIAITDQGIGIAPADQARVFERFYRAGGQTATPQGSGLGLAIAKGFVEASGGGITLVSPSENGRGTTITIRLPRAKEHPLS